jgi:transcriptional regulator with XRE-family HTH domain
MQLITRMRLKAGMSRYRLAADAGVDYNHVKKLETGVSRNPSRQVLVDLAGALAGYTSMYSQKDVTRILKAAGFPPPPVRPVDTDTGQAGDRYAERGNYGEFARPKHRAARSGFPILSLFHKRKDRRKKARRKSLSRRR